MTDNRTTELLREGLTEHGIEWRSGLEGVTFVGDWCFVEYENEKLAATCEPVLTPEQAIAATLGGWTCENVAREWEKTSLAHACTSFCCSECGAHYVDAECYYAGLADKDEEQIRTSFCPNCGRRVSA